MSKRHNHRNAKDIREKLALLNGYRDYLTMETFNTKDDYCTLHHLELYCETGTTTRDKSAPLLNSSHCWIHKQENNEELYDDLNDCLNRYRQLLDKVKNNPHLQELIDMWELEVAPLILEEVKIYRKRR